MFCWYIMQTRYIYIKKNLNYLKNIKKDLKNMNPNKHI